MTNGVQAHLLSGGRIVREGKLFPGLLPRPVEVFLIPLSLLWGGFALFWNVTAWAMGADLFFNLFGLPFLVVSLYVTIGRFLVDIAIRRRTTYAVTDRRVLIVRGGTGVRLISLDIRRLPALSFNEPPDGSGTIRFGAAIGRFSGANNFGIWQPTFDLTPQFLRVVHVRSAYALI